MGNKDEESKQYEKEKMANINLSKLQGAYIKSIGLAKRQENPEEAKAVSQSGTTTQISEETDVFKFFVACMPTVEELRANAMHVQNEQLKQKGITITPLTAIDKMHYDSYVEKNEIFTGLDSEVKDVVAALMRDEMEILTNPEGYDLKFEANSEQEGYFSEPEASTKISSLEKIDYATIQKLSEDCMPTMDEIVANAQNIKLIGEGKASGMLTGKQMADFHSYLRKKAILESLEPKLKVKVLEKLRTERERLNTNSKGYDLSTLSRVPVFKRKGEEEKKLVAKVSKKPEFTVADVKRQAEELKDSEKTKKRKPALKMG